jgi:hypothetical protein
MKIKEIEVHLKACIFLAICIRPSQLTQIHSDQGMIYTNIIPTLMFWVFEKFCSEKDHFVCFAAEATTIWLLSVIRAHLVPLLIGCQGVPLQTI